MMMHQRRLGENAPEKLPQRGEIARDPSFSNDSIVHDMMLEGEWRIDGSVVEKRGKNEKGMVEQGGEAAAMCVHECEGGFVWIGME